MNIFGKRREHPGGEALSEYLSGRLAPGEARRIETHVDACAACREELDSLGYAVGLMRRVPMVRPRTTFVLSQAPTEGAPRGWALRLPGWAYGAAASVAAVVFVVVLSADMGGLLTEDAVTGAQDSPTVADAPSPVSEAALAGAAVPQRAGEGAGDRPIGLEREAGDEAPAMVATTAPTAAMAGAYESTVHPAHEPPTLAAMAMASEDTPAMAKPEPSPGPTRAAALEKAVEEPVVTPAPAATVAVAPTEVAEPEEAAEAVQAQAAAARSVVEPAVAEPTAVPAAEAAEPLESPEAVEAEDLVEVAEVDITTPQPVEDRTPEPTPRDIAEPDIPTSRPVAAPVAPSVERDETAGAPVTEQADGFDGTAAPEMEEDEAPAPVPTEPTHPATRAPWPTPQVAQVPEAAPSMATRGTTSVLWRVLEGAAAALVLVAGGMFLWVRRRRAA